MGQVNQIKGLEEKINDILPKDELVDITQAIPPDLVVDRYEGYYWKPASPSVKGANADFSCINKIDAVEGDQFIVIGIGSFPGNSGRCLDASGNSISTINSSHYVVIGSGHLLTVPAGASIASIALNFNSGEAANVIVNAGNVLITEEEFQIKKSLYDAVGKSKVFKNLPENLAVGNTDMFWNTFGALVGNVGFGALNKIAIGSEKNIAIKGLVDFDTETQQKFGRMFNGFAVIGDIYSYDLKYTNGGYTLELPAMCTDVGIFADNVFLIDTINDVEVYIGTEVILHDEIMSEIIPNKIKTDPELTLFYNRGKEDVLVGDDSCYLIAGQSQFDGRIPIADLPAWWAVNSDKIPSTQIYRYETSDFGNYDSSIFAQNGASFSMEIHLLKAIVDNQVGVDPLHSVNVIKRTLGGTSISPVNGDGAGKWTPEFEKIASGQSHLLSELKSYYQTAELTVPASDYKVNGLFWANGEGDRNASGDYYRNLKIMLAYIRGFLGNSTLPVLLFGINNKSVQYNSTVENAKRQLAVEDSFIFYVEVATNELTHLQSDKIHYNTAGGIEITDTAFDIMMANKSIFGLL